MGQFQFKLILKSLIFLAIFGISSSIYSQTQIEDIGVIKQSIFKPKQFNKTQNGTWVLLDGSQISKDTKLFELLEENFNLDILTLKEDGNYYLPDASGVFIRASNVNGKGKDPDKDRKVGSIQNDTIKKHEHKYYAGSKNYTEYNTGAKTYRINPKWQNTKSDFGGTETRPVNISMYTYIKISN